MSEKKLEEIMSKDKSLVRRVSGIDVEEVTLTKKGALGDEADAVILYKEEDEKANDVKEDEVAELEKEQETTEEATEEVAELEKEEVAEDTTDGNVEMDFDSAISFIQKGELTDEQKQSVLDTALVMFDAADLEKEAAEPEASEVVDLLKQILEKVSPSEETPELEKEIPEQFKKKEKKTDDNSEEGEDKEDKKPEFLKKEEVSVIDKVEQALRESKAAKLAKEQSDKEAEVHNKLNEMSSVLSGLTKKFTETQRRLSRECGIDA